MVAIPRGEEYNRHDARQNTFCCEVEAMLRRKNVNMLSGPIMSGLFIVAFPIVVQTVLTSMFNMVDMRVLKTFDTDGLAVGSVGVCSTLIGLITNLVIGISTGANAVVARHLGRKDPEDARKAAGTAILFSAIAGMVLTVIGVFGAETFLKWTNCPETLLSRAVLYFRLYFVGVPILTVHNFSCAIIRSSGNSKRVMEISLIAGAVKVVLTYLFVGLFKGGIVGVSMATILSWLLAGWMSWRTIIKGNGSVKISLKDVRYEKTELKEVLRIGVPSGLQLGLYSIANVIIVSTVNTFGAEATTGLSIANTFDGIIYNFSHATSLAVLPYVSQNVGAGNIKRATQSVWRGILLAIVLAGGVGALSAIFSPQLSSLLSSDSVVIDYSCQKMMIISSTYFICGVFDVFGAALRGMGRPVVPTIATMLFMCALRFVWVYVIFPLLPTNLTFLYLVWPVGWVLSIILMACVLFPRMKELKAQHPETLAAT